MAGVAFELPSTAIAPVHELRKTFAGIQNLKQTGRFREYMQEIVDSKNRPFISWDGEGWNNGMEHQYMLLQNSYGDYIESPQLGTNECLDLIIKSGVKYPKHIHIAFAFGYDVTHILRDLPQEKRAELMESGVINYYPRDENGQVINRFTIQYIPHKWFTVTGRSWEKKRNVTVKIYDIMTFFQSSFIKALQSREIEVPDVITSGKAGRATFTYSDMAEIQTYCQMELEMMVELANKLRAEFQEAGVYVTQYHGPGAVASAVFKENKIKDHMQRTPDRIEYAAQRAYFGGRFEQFKAGHYAGKVYQYDIRSAYPDKIRNLPSLAGSRWEYTTDYDGSMGVWFCSYDSGTAGGILPHPIPWRGKGGIVGFPESVAGVWLWHHEAKFATTVHHGYKLILANDSQPFDFVERMYCKRQEWKQLGLGAERAIKLALNSLYGKMAQRIGGSEKNGGVPPWHQLEWAGMVTSATRAQIYEAMAQAPQHIIAVETDGIFSTVPLDLDVGEALGQWEYKEYDWITYVQSGIYFTPDDKHGEKAKSRGIDVTQLHHADVLAYMRGDISELLVSTRQFIGLSNPAKWNYGQWQDSVKEVKIAGSKRIHIPANCTACESDFPMDKYMHDLSANPLYGSTESAKHPLPWRDGPNVPLTDLEFQKVNTAAVSEFEVSTRHTPELFNSLDEEIPF